MLSSHSYTSMQTHVFDSGKFTTQLQCIDSAAIDCNNFCLFVTCSIMFFHVLCWINLCLYLQFHLLNLFWLQRLLKLEIFLCFCSSMVTFSITPFTLSLSSMLLLMASLSSLLRFVLILFFAYQLLVPDFLWFCLGKFISGFCWLNNDLFVVCFGIEFE